MQRSKKFKLSIIIGLTLAVATLLVLTQNASQTQAPIAFLDNKEITSKPMNLVNVIIENGELNEFYAADIDSNGLLNASEFSDLLQSSSNSSEYFPDGLTQE